MSKVRNLTEITALDDADLFYTVDVSTNPNGGRKITKANLRSTLIQTAAPVSTGTANTEGSASTLAKSDHVHKTVIQNYTATSIIDATTTSTTDVLLTSMSIVNPMAGDYFVSFRTSSLNSANGSERNYYSIYVGGVKAAESEIRVGIAGGGVVSLSCQAKVTVNGSQNIEVYWRVVAGTGTSYQRSLSAFKVG